MRLLLIIQVLLFASIVNADDLPQISNPELSFVLANFQILSKVGLPESKISVKIIKVRDNGECDGSPQSCPKTSIYITASEYGEYPEQKTYVLPKKYGWDFVEWVSLPKFEGPNDYVVLRVVAKVANSDTAISWWKDEYYLVKVNYHNGIWEKQ